MEKLFDRRNTEFDINPRDGAIAACTFLIDCNYDERMFCMCLYAWNVVVICAVKIALREINQQIET